MPCAGEIAGLGGTKDGLGRLAGREMGVGIERGGEFARSAVEREERVGIGGFGADEVRDGFGRGEGRDVAWHGMAG